MAKFYRASDVLEREHRPFFGAGWPRQSLQGCLSAGGRAAVCHDILNDSVRVLGAVVVEV
jgi:hypothetical protein